METSFLLVARNQELMDVPSELVSFEIAIPNSAPAR